MSGLKYWRAHNEYAPAKEELIRSHRIAPGIPAAAFRPSRPGARRGKGLGKREPGENSNLNCSRGQKPEKLPEDGQRNEATRCLWPENRIRKDPLRRARSRLARQERMVAARPPKVP